MKGTFIKDFGMAFLYRAVAMTVMLGGMFGILYATSHWTLARTLLNES